MHCSAAWRSISPAASGRLLHLCSGTEHQPVSVRRYVRSCRWTLEQHMYVSHGPLLARPVLLHRRYNGAQLEARLGRRGRIDVTTHEHSNSNLWAL